MEGAVPEPAESTNQGWSLTPVKVSDPDPVFVMLTLAGARLDAPTCPEKLKLPGLTASTEGAGFTVKAAEELLLVSARLVAVTVTEVGEDTVGAVNKPDELTVPAVADQVTATFAVLLTSAINCWVALETTVAFDGEMETLTAAAQ